MNHPQSDALVFFGATGDLAYKKIFPSLQAMIKRGTLNIPIIGVAKNGWSLEQLRERARDSLEHHGGIDTAAFARLMELLRYIDGGYEDLETFKQLKKALGGAERPAHYLAIPPTLFGTVVEHMAAAGCAPAGARVVVEKPFGRDLESARALNRILLKNLSEEERTAFWKESLDRARARGLPIFGEDSPPKRPAKRKPKKRAAKQKPIAKSRKK